MTRKLCYTSDHLALMPILRLRLLFASLLHAVTDLLYGMNDRQYCYRSSLLRDSTICLHISSSAIRVYNTSHISFHSVPDSTGDH